MLHLLRIVQTLGFEVFHRAAILVRPHGRTRLRLMNNATTGLAFTRIAEGVARGA